MADILTQALFGSQWAPIETPWGIGASALAQGVPQLINPQGSSRSNAIKAIGGTLLAGLMGHFAQSQADERNAGLFGAMQEYQTATPERRQQIVSETPRFSNIAMALAGQQNALDQEMARYQAMTPLALDRLQQEEQIKADNDIRVWGARGRAMGGGMGRQAGMMGMGDVTQGAFAPGTTQINPPVATKYEPEKYEDFKMRKAREYQMSGIPAGRAGEMAAQDASAIYGKVADIRKKLSEDEMAASKAVSAIEQMERALPKIKAGPIATSFQGIKQTLVEKDIAPFLKEELEARQSYQTAASSLVKENLKGLGQATDNDLKFAQMGVGMLEGGRTKDEAAAAVATLKPMKDNAQQLLREKSKWVARYQTDQGFDEAYWDYAQDEPIYTPEGKVRSRKPFSQWFEEQKKKGELEAYAPANVANAQSQQGNQDLAQFLQLEAQRRGGVIRPRGGMR